MTGKERLFAVLDGKIPDKIPHFEIEFQIEQEAFGIRRPSYNELINADPDEKKILLENYFSVCENLIERYDWCAIRAENSFYGPYEGEFIPMAKERFGERAAVYSANGDGTFWMPSGEQFMDFTIRLFEDFPSLLKEARKKCDVSIELAYKQIKQGADFILINSDYGYNQGPFISPYMFSELVTPFLKEIVDAIHSMGKKAILHSDGDLRLLLDQLVSTGLDGYQSVDPQGNMDISEVKKNYPDLILMGNVQTSLLQEVNDELIRQSVRYAINSAKSGGKYIFSTSNCIFEGMPLESYEIMLDEYEKLAWY